jgi:MoaA/NifB/PqqE/SkfB family radical SAM enzyme
MALFSMARVTTALKKLRVTCGCLQGLDFLWLEITRCCNLACLHCYAGSGPQLPLTERMKFDDWCRVIDDARSLGCRRLQFIGGEPTIHPDLERLLEHANEAGFRRCEVFTNLTAVRDDLARTFKRLDVLVHFSFYSSDPAVHDQITGQSGSFERTVAGIRTLARRRVRLAAGIITVPQNAAQVGQTRASLRRLGIRSIAIDRVRGIGRGEQFVVVSAPKDELCGACWNRRLCVDANGVAHPCVFSRSTSVGSVLDESLSAIISGARLREFRREMFLGTEGDRK